MLELLALLPITYFLLIFLISWRYGQLHDMSKNYAITYLDWIFVPFNLLLGSAVQFSWIIFLVILVFSSAVSVLLNIKWKNIKNKPKETLFVVNDKGLTLQGKIHLVFMSVQSALVLTAVISRAISDFYIILLALIFAYCISYLLIVKYIRRVRLTSKSETPVLIAGLSLLILRTIIYTLGY